MKAVAAYVCDLRILKRFVRQRTLFIENCLRGPYPSTTNKQSLLENKWLVLRCATTKQ